MKLLGDGQVSAWCAAGLLDGQREVRLRNSHLGDAGAVAVAESLGEAVVELDLSGNSVGTMGAEALGRTAAPSLETLILSGNGLADTAIRRLCAGLARPGSPQLLQLSLAENHITLAGRALGELLGSQKRLTFLDLHWNYLTGDGALGLFEGMCGKTGEGGGGCSKLARLDVSWNCLGNTGAEATVAALAAALEEEESALVHLDLSYNSLRAEECAALGMGLRDNHTLLGLHLVGNAASVDANGFVVARKATTPKHSQSRPASPAKLLGQVSTAPVKKTFLVSSEERAAIHAAFRAVDADGSGTVEASELGATMRDLGLDTSPGEAVALVARADSDGNGSLDINEFTALMESLIIKEREDREAKRARDLEMDRERSLLEARTSCWICESWQPIEIEYTGEATAVWAYLSLDNFEQATKLEKDSTGRFVCERMLPPEQVWVVLQVDNGLGLLPKMPTATLPKPVPIRLRSAEELPEAPQSTLIAREVSIIELSGRGKNQECPPPCAQTRTVVLDDPNKPGGIYVVPRMTQAEHQRRKKAKPWCFERSIFAEWRFENEKNLSTACCKDFHTTKAAKFIKGKDYDRTLQVVKAHYATFLRLYRRCASLSTAGASTFGVGMTVAADMLTAADVMDDAFCRPSDVDTMFIAARVREKGADKRPFSVKADDKLLRFQFMELLLRVAVARYGKTEDMSPPDAVAALFQKLKPQAHRPSSDLQKFHKVLHIEACDKALKKHEPLLRSIFSCHSGRFTKPGLEPQMSCKEFEEMLAGSEVFNDAFPAREAPYAFLMGMQLYPDELYSLDFATMNFLEFLHGFSAALYLRREDGPLAEVLDRFLVALSTKHLLNGFLRGLR